MFGKFYGLEVHDAGESADLVFDGRARDGGDAERAWREGKGRTSGVGGCVGRNRIVWGFGEDWDLGCLWRDGGVGMWV